MFIAFDVKKGIEYAKLCHSKWENGKSVKKYTYLGRVVDKENGVYFNKKTGYCSFDKEQNKVVLLPNFVPNNIERNAKETSTNSQDELILQFGPEYFLDAYIENIGLKKCIEQFGYSNNDSLLTMLLFNMIEAKPYSYAENWYKRSYCRILYPKANVESQEILDIFASIGAEEKQKNFFASYFDWLKNDIGESRRDNILIDRTCLPRNVYFPLTAISNSGGTISKDVRLIYAVHKTTGVPIFFRYWPGNNIDANTIIDVVDELKCHNFDIEHAIIDDSCVTLKNVDALFKHNIDFIAKLPSNGILYKDIVKSNIDNINDKKNLTRYNGRYFFIKCIECNIKGLGEVYNEYAYLIKDINCARYEEEREMMLGVAEDIDDEEIFNKIQNKGIFILISSKKYDAKNILPFYCAGLQIEQVFSIANNNVSISSLLVHGENIFRGYLVLSFISTSILRKLHGLLSNYNMSPEKELYRLKALMCKIYGNTIHASEADPKTNELFRLANIKFPDKIVLSHCQERCPKII